MSVIEVYRDKAGGYRWRKKADNGEITADSAEAYTRRGDCWEAAWREAGKEDRIVQLNGPEEAA